MSIILCILAAWLVLVPMICAFNAAAARGDANRTRTLDASRRPVASHGGRGGLRVVRR